jgi:hypothetical protein
MSGDEDNPATAHHEAGQLLFPAISLRQAALGLAAVFAIEGLLFLLWWASLLDFDILILLGLRLLIPAVLILGLMGARKVLFPAVSIRDGGIVLAAVLAAVGLLFWWQATLLDFGTLVQPGAGMVPLVLGVATVGLAGLIGAWQWQQPDGGETVELGHRDVLIVFVAMLAVPLLFDPLGAYVTLGLFGAVLLVLVARTPLVIAVVASVVGMVACWYFFQVALGLQLPLGSVWSWFTQLNG